MDNENLKNNISLLTCTNKTFYIIIVLLICIILVLIYNNYYCDNLQKSNIKNNINLLDKKNITIQSSKQLPDLLNEIELFHRKQDIYINNM